MKRTLSLLLVFTLLALTACQSTPAAPSGEESAPPPTPWAQLQAVSDELSAIYESVAPIVFPDTSAMEATEGTGTLSVTVTQGADDGSVSGESMSFRGDMTMGGNVSKTEIAYVMDGVSIPIVTWTKDGKEYVQYPDMYPDGVFRVEDLGDSALLPSFDFSMGGMGAGSSEASFTEKFEELADPDQNMVLVEKDGNKVFTLRLDGEDAVKLWEEIDKVLDETLGAVTDDGLIGELSTGDEEETRNYTHASLTITTDGKTFQKLLLEGFDGETVVDSLAVDSSVKNSSVVRSVVRKEEGETTLELSATSTIVSTTITGKILSQGTEVELDLILTEKDGVTDMQGSITMTMEMEGFSFSLPLDISMTVKTVGDTTELALTMGMNIMGMAASYAIQMSVTPGEVDLTFPYDDKILTYDEEEFYNKMMEAYPDLFYTSQSSCYYSEDEKLYMSADEDGYVDIYVDTVYTKEGNVYTIENFGSYTIEESDGSYTINGTSCDGTDFEDGLSVFVEGDTGASLSFYTDGTCSVNLWGYGESDALRAVFETGDALALSWQFSADYTTVTVLGQTLYLDLSGSTEI